MEQRNSFQQPEVLWESDRSFADKHERVRLERSEYQGHPTFALRILWKTPEGDWRWSTARPDAKGRCWASLNLKAKELHGLAAALSRAACDLEGTSAAPPEDGAPRARGHRQEPMKPRVPLSEAEKEDLPF